VIGGKKQNLPLPRLNGKERVRIETIHGSFEFTEQRFLLPDGSSCRYLKQTGQGLRSSGIEEFCLYYCNRLSFAEVSKLLQRVSGERLLCEQTLWNWVQSKAREVSIALSWEVSASRWLPMPTFAEALDIYDADSEEVLVSSDAIQVKAQKPTRERHRGWEAEDTPREEEKKKEKIKKERINTDLMLLEGRDGSFRHLSAGLGGGEGAVSLCEVARAYLRREWGEHPEPVPIVAVTDGARSIRLMLEELFGPSVRVILDWYHLSKKVYQLLSMVAHTKAERKQMEGRVLSFLWHGRVSEALSYLGGVSARREEALRELVTYLQKHASEIIDYELRAKAGKVIGSGRMEKAVDQAVGIRQKKKGMSWSERGSHALALLKVVELNGEWDELWAEAGVAA
jgi:hypothetical protein